MCGQSAAGLCAKEDEVVSTVTDSGFLTAPATVWIKGAKGTKQG